MSEWFPSRFMTPKELHVMTNIYCGTCVYCSAQFIDNEKRGKKVCFEKDKKIMFLHCSFCTIMSKDKSTSFLCNKHFVVFHYFAWKVVIFRIIFNLRHQNEAYEDYCKAVKVKLYSCLLYLLFYFVKLCQFMYSISEFLMYHTYSTVCKITFCRNFEATGN